MQIDKERLMAALDAHVRSETGRRPEDVSDRAFWVALADTLVQFISESWAKTRKHYETERMQHYLSAEFLMGRSMLNNLLNLGIYDTVRDCFKAYGRDLSVVLDEEYDAGLGNGGLGRLAACFLDSCATRNYPVIGYGILYRYGLFRQTFENGFQHEYPDSWMEDGYPFLVKRDDLQVRVHYNDMDIIAMPFDLPIIGEGTENVNTLRLWRADPAQEFDFNLFNSQRFDDAVAQRNQTEDIWRVLYPNDSSYEGKVLRVRQQYFFVSATLQSVIRKYREVHGDDMTQFAKYNVFQLNDTHPVIAIPELMRLLLDEHHLSWEQAWQITCQVFAYTNHTILAEALERWDIGIFQFLFPRILEIIQEIDRRFRIEMTARGLRQDRIDYMAPVGNGQVRMAWLACYAAFSINGVAALHTDILKRETLHDWYEIWPERFNNKTNGVTPRRWLRNCNPELAQLLTEVSGSDAWVCHLERLDTCVKFGDDPQILERLLAIKQKNKQRLADWIFTELGIEIRTDAISDVQIKRLHEYKRQILNAFYILDLYYRMKADTERKLPARVCIFGAKAAPGYMRAKAVIKFINEIANLINRDPEVANRLKVIFIPNYNVSNAERIIPAADISEQISTAGKEASGTGNMKLMMNGALTLGTFDGANVEIVEAVGNDNAYIFGVREEDLPATRAYYNPNWQYQNIPGLKRVLDSLVDGTLDDQGSGMFADLYNSLLQGSNWEPADVYYVLGDFDDYRKTRDRMAEDYQDRQAWAKRCWINICRSGRFSSDRTIDDYVKDIWRLKSLPIADVKA